MEAANIDWNNVESVFVEDSLYEHINAPKWIDFSAPDNEHIVNDEAWFCKPDCRHSKTAEDFKVKHSTSLSAALENLPLRDRKIRDGNGSSMSKRLNKARTFHVQEEDGENENPNFSTPSKNKGVKPLEEEKGRKLKSTASASNLFAGREILNQITEFCSELKKMVMKGKDEKNEAKEKLLEQEPKKKPLPPLGEARKEKTPVTKTPPSMEEKKQRRIIKRGEKENSPMTLDLKAVGKGKDEKQRLLQVRTNPPSPQCFSTEPLRRPKLNTTPLKPLRSIPLEKEVDTENAGNVSATGKETRTMEMLWILKPCLAK